MEGHCTNCGHPYGGDCNGEFVSTDEAAEVVAEDYADRERDC